MPAGQAQEDVPSLAMPSVGAITLCFDQPATENSYLNQVAKSRWRVCLSIFCFDLACFAFRGTIRASSLLLPHGLALSSVLVICKDLAPQLAGMLTLYFFVWLLNLRSRWLGNSAARQEELFLSAVMAMAVCSLLAGLDRSNASDYVFACFFLICTTTFLKIRWWVGTAIMAMPTALALSWHLGKEAPILPHDGLVHIAVAWAVGGLMAYLAEGYRRQMFSSQLMAASAHQKELLEARARIKAQRQLAAAQAQAAHRALTVTREKASNEAKSEFMSLMCHEVRTPLNGCLASAEMLLDTTLDEEQRELAKTICVSGAILLSTVSNFLDFFKLEAGKALDVVRTEVGLSHLVGDVHCIIEALVGHGGVGSAPSASAAARSPPVGGKAAPAGGGTSPSVSLLEPRIGPKVPSRVLCDPDRVRGVLLNLYTNAAKFTKSGHIGLRVSEVQGAAVPQPPPHRPAGDGSLGYAAVTATPPANLIPPPSPHRAGTSGRSRRGSTTLTSGLLSAVASQAGYGSDGDSLAEPFDRLEEALMLQRTADAARWLLFEVFDTGVGIHPEGLRALFKDYVQGTEDEMRKPRSRGGTGLGLSICSKQVGVLGGRIGAYSCPGLGSTFWFTIPLELPPAASAHHPESAGVAATSSVHHPERGGSEAGDVPLEGRGEGGAAGAAEARAANRTAAAFTSHADSELRCVSRSSETHLEGDTHILCTVKEAYEGNDGPPGVSSETACPLFRLDHLDDHQLGSWSSSELSGGLPAAGSDGAASASAAAASASSSEARAVDAQVQLIALLGNGSLPPSLHQPGGGSLLLGGRSMPTSLRPVGESLSPLRPGGSSGGSDAVAATSLQQSRMSVGSTRPSMEQRGRTSLEQSSIMGGVLLAGHSFAPPRRSISADLIRGQRALLVEDNIINQTVARKMLTSLGMECEVASNGLEAVQAVQRAHEAQARDPASASMPYYLVILMDMSMPVMGGVDATRAIRKLEEGGSAGGSGGGGGGGSAPPPPSMLPQRIPILAMTANASDRDRDECRSAGMDGFLSKPVLKDRLVDAILQVVQGKAWAA